MRIRGTIVAVLMILTGLIYAAPLENHANCGEDQVTETDVVPNPGRTELTEEEENHETNLRLISKHRDLLLLTMEHAGRTIETPEKESVLEKNRREERSADDCRAVNQLVQDLWKIEKGESRLELKPSRFSPTSYIEGFWTPPLINGLLALAKQDRCMSYIPYIFQDKTFPAKLITPKVVNTLLDVAIAENANMETQRTISMLMIQDSGYWLKGLTKQGNNVDPNLFGSFPREQVGRRFDGAGYLDSAVKEHQFNLLFNPASAKVRSAAKKLSERARDLGFGVYPFEKLEEFRMELEKQKNDAPSKE